MSSPIAATGVPADPVGTGPAIAVADPEHVFRGTAAARRTARNGWPARLARGLLLNCSGWVVFIFVWWLATTTGVVRTSYLSAPQTVFTTLIGLFRSGEVWGELLPSLRRALAGFVLSVVTGVVLGIALGWFRLFERLVDPVLQFFRQLSAFALFPVFILFLGVGEPSKIAIVFWAAFWPVLLNTIAAVKGVERLQINAARSMGAGRWFIFTAVVLPASLPRIFPGIRLGGAYSITALVAAEMVGASHGLGIFVLTSQQVFRIPEMYAGIVLLALLGLGFNWILLVIERRVTRWQRGIVHS